MLPAEYSGEASRVDIKETNLFVLRLHFSQTRLSEERM